jgi:uncharacterized protein with PQ loop repeat
VKYLGRHDTLKENEITTPMCILQPSVKMEALSNVFGALSMIFYTIVYVPQFDLMYKTKSSAGISLFTIYLWTQSDSLSLISTILLQLPMSLVAIGWFHFLIGVLMLCVVIHYRRRETSSRKFEVVWLCVFTVVNIAMASVIQGYNLSNENLGEGIGWITTIVYIVGRAPQIYENHKKRSTAGLSMLMYTFTILGNLFYVMSVFAYSTEYDYIILNMAWITLAVTNILLDLVVICQSRYYNHNHHNNNNNKTSQPIVHF